MLPLPDFGRGIKTGMGSWAWAISSTCPAPEGAWAFMADLLSTDGIVRMTNLNGAIPARRSACTQTSRPRAPAVTRASRHRSGLA